MSTLTKPKKTTKPGSLSWWQALLIVAPFAALAVGVLVTPEAPAPSHCPTEDSCSVRVDYHGGEWHMVVTEVQP